MGDVVVAAMRAGKKRRDIGCGAVDTAGGWSPMIRFFSGSKFPKLPKSSIIPVAAIFASFQDLYKCRETDIVKKSGDGQVLLCGSGGFPGSVFRRGTIYGVNAIWEEMRKMLRDARCITTSWLKHAHQKNRHLIDQVIGSYVKLQWSLAA